MTQRSGSMRFGLIVNSDERGDRSALLQVEEHLERARVAREAGFDTLAVAHRYSFGPAIADERGQPLSTSRLQPLLLLAYLAAEMRETMHYATTILLSMSAHPVQLAEDVATLDALCHGRLHLGVGLGWMPYEFEAFGVATGERASRFDELLEVYRLLLTQSNVTYRGRHFKVREARLIARGVQRPMPPLWVGASSDGAVRRAARLGDAWIISAHLTAAVVERQLAVYGAELHRLGKPFPAELPMNRLVYVGRDRETAFREAEAALAEWYRKRGSWGWFLTKDICAKGGNKAMHSEHWIIGSPEDCVEHIGQLRDRLGVNHLILGMPWLGTDQEKRLTAIRLLGERVLPYLRAR
jgi:alkanesulfonate monooxygenase SsuD/methylene tetrahydromethanopterin reductase-like flavin-dependent oxidoreductase (luciferase family)